METIDRIESPTAEYFREHYLIPNKPVIITGLTQNWPASPLALDYIYDIVKDSPEIAAGIFRKLKRSIRQLT